MKKIEIEIPDGKRAEWVNGVLTLIDEAPKDITERIKTFDDALAELGEEHPLVREYNYLYDDQEMSKDLFAYMKLRIIVAALNEGWKPQFTEDEWRYYPCFYLYTQEEWDNLSEEEKDGWVLSGGYASYGAYAGFAFADSNDAPSITATSIGSRLCLKSEELAVYCGKQFIDIWADFIG